MSNQSSDNTQPLKRQIAIDRLLVRVAIVITIGMLLGAFVSVWDEARNGGAVPRVPVGTDFVTFHGAASLVVDGAGDDVYTPSILGEKIAFLASYEPFDSQHYGHPPFFPLFFIPLAHLPFTPAYVLFVAGGAAAMALAIARVGSVRPLYALGLALVSIPGFATVQLGQVGFWVVAVLLAVYLALRRGYDFAAGLLLGLLVFKPFYAVGVGIWWLMRGRRYLAAIGGAVSTTLVLVAAGFLIRGGWSAYLSFVDESLTGLLSDIARSGFSLFEMWSTLLPGPLATSLWLVTGTAVLVMFRRFAVAFDNRLEITFALAVILGLLVSTRLGWYDWVLLVVPAVLLWEALPDHRSRLVVAGAWLFPVAALSWPVARGLDGSVGVYWQIAPIALALISWWYLKEAVPSSGQEAAPVIGPAATC